MGEPRVFLFTDIEGSTRLWESSSGAMPAVLASHDALLGQAIASTGGRVFKTVGDAICAVFPDPISAVCAAVAGQESLAAFDWRSAGLERPLRVRMAIQAGHAEQVGDDFAGAVLNRLARLLSAGHGGQILLDGETAEAVRNALPAGTSLRDLGERRLRDVPGRVRIAQLTVDRLPSLFPPLRLLESIDHNIPAQLDSFIGRTAERQRIRSHFMGETGRLMTLLGPGGIGKTRLAIESAREMIDEFADGVWFVDLSAAREGDGLGALVMRVLGLRESTESTAEERVLTWLRERETLLVLDNCEHVIDESARFADVLLRGASQVRVLATSRIPLEIRGEQRLPLEPLALPVHTQAAEPEVMGKVPSVELFVSRASSIQPDFSLDTANAPDVAEVCRQVEGIPLALELAAARITVFSPAEFTTQLQRRLRVLETRSRGLPERHQTLRNAIAWSYELLPSEEQLILQRLSVFAGGWTVEAMAHILDLDEIDASTVIESLCAQSLVRAVVDQDGTHRYTMLESIREFAGEFLANAPELESLTDQHARYYTSQAEEAESSLLGDERQFDWMRSIDHDLDNFRQAANWWIVRRNAESALTLCTSLWNYWSIRGSQSEGRRWLQQALELVEDQPHSQTRARALRKLGNLSIDLGDTQSARALYEESLAIEQAAGNGVGIAESLSNLGMVAGMQGRFDDELALLTESYEIWRSMGHLRGQSVTLLNLGIHARDEGDGELAARLHEEALAIAREMGDQLGAAWIDLYHARLDRDAGRLQHARERIERSVAVFEDAGDSGGIGHVHNELGRLALLEGNLTEAERRFDEGRALHAKRGDKPATAESLEGLAMTSADKHDYLAAVQSLAEANALRSEASWPVQRAERAARTALEETLRKSLGDRIFETYLDGVPSLPQALDSPVH